MQTSEPDAGLAGAAGWFGKLPVLGDFASRRLSPDFIDAWDGWLSRGLLAWQSEAPNEWLHAYLNGPTWRFLLMPGALPGSCGRTGWAGVLMPSVDRVGRYFPFTLALPLRQLPQDPAQAQALLAWLHRLDDTALDALHEDWTVERLETALLREQRLDLAAARDTAFDTAFDTAITAPASGPLADLAAFAQDPGLQGRAFWLSADQKGEPQLYASQGLPQGAHFAALLRGTPLPGPDPVHPRPTASTHDD